MPKAKTVTLRTVLNRMNRDLKIIQNDLKRSSENRINPMHVLEDVANSKLTYLKKIEKDFDNDLSKIGSMINKFSQIITELNNAKSQGMKVK
jgi:hypothetical protein